MRGRLPGARGQQNASVSGCPALIMVINSSASKTDQHFVNIGANLYTSSEADFFVSGQQNASVTGCPALIMVTAHIIKVHARPVIILSTLQQIYVRLLQTFGALMHLLHNFSHWSWAISPLSDSP